MNPQTTTNTVPPAVRQQALKITTNCTDLCSAIAMAYKEQRLQIQSTPLDGWRHDLLMEKAIMRCTSKCFHSAAREEGLKPAKPIAPIVVAKQPTTPTDAVLTLGLFGIVAYGAVGIWGNKK